MKIFNRLTLKFEQPEWITDPELALFDEILNEYPCICELIKDDILKISNNNDRGRQDSPTVEQVLRSAIYKEMRKLTYRDLEYAEKDSKICEHFLKLEGREPFSYQVLQKYISSISGESLKKVLVEINKIAMAEGMENLKSIKRIRLDTTVVETDIHYPTNNHLVWDSIRKLDRQLKQIAQAHKRKYRSTIKQAKKNFFKINVEKKDEKRQEVFEEQLKLLMSLIKLGDSIIGKCATHENEIADLLLELEDMLKVSRQVHDVAYRHQILKEKVSSHEKVVSIFERHTDIIVKGNREVKFGHKVSIATNKSNLILDCEVIKGNPKDTELFIAPLERIKYLYHKEIESVATDGGYASQSNLETAKHKLGIKNIVFNKIVGTMKSIAQSKTLETQLKKWRSGIEAVISNVKRGFDLRRCTWKGDEHFDAKVLWSVIGYNIRVISGFMLNHPLLA